MKYRQLGSTGLVVSVIGFGTVKFGRNQGVKYPSAFELPDDRSAASLLALAQELGINLVDTAPAYGSSEERLGKLLKGQRQQWLVCTKTGEEFEQGVSRFDFSAAHTRFSVERSLKRLGTDYLDMVLVHSNGDDETIIEKTDVLETLAALKHEGKIRAFGLSTKTPAGSLLAAQRSDVVMLTYNLEERSEATTIDYCETHNKGVLVKKAFGSGHLVKQGDDPVQASTDFIFAKNGISSVIVGTLSPDHLRHNVACTLRSCP